MGDMVMPGFRFYPTEEELLCFYLQNKLMGVNISSSADAQGQQQLHRVIPVVDIYDYNAWDLPRLAGEFCRKDSEQWFFFVPRQEREARGGRPRRITTQGYWKATGSPCEVYSVDRNTVIGRKRTMVFYVGRAPHGTKTAWKMNEYKAIIIVQPHHELAASSSSSTANPQACIREELSLCRIYKNSRTLRAFNCRPPPPDAISGVGVTQEAAEANIMYPVVVPGMPTDGSGSLDRTSPPHGNATNVNTSQVQSEAVNEEDSGGEPAWEQLSWLFDI